MVSVVVSVILIIVIIVAQLGICRASRRQSANFPGQEAVIRAIQLRSQKVSKEVRKMLLSLILGFGPLLLTAVIKMGFKVDYVFLISPWVVLVVTFNSAVITYIHLNGNNEIRQAVKNIIKCRRGNAAVVPLS